MSKRALTLDEAEALTQEDDRFWFEGWTLIAWKPTRAGSHWFKRDAMYNRNWRSKYNKWGTYRRIEPNSQGMYIV